MKKILGNIFTVGGVVWPPFLPIFAVVFSINFCGQFFFLLSAIISILFYSIFAFEIHNWKSSDEEYVKNGKKEFVYNQYWFNALGAIVGWSALYILLFYVIRIEYYPLSSALFIWTRHLSASDLFLIVASFLGLTGYIPYYALLGKEK